MSTETKKSAADVRKGLKTTRADLTVTILPNIKLDEKGDYAILKLLGSRIVENGGDPFTVHDVTFLEGSIDVCYVGKEKVKTPLTAKMDVSLKGNARLDRGFAKMNPGQSAMIEYLGKVDVGQGRSANDYNFDLIA